VLSPSQGTTDPAETNAAQVFLEVATRLTPALGNTPPIRARPALTGGSPKARLRTDAKGRVDSNPRVGRILAQTVREARIVPSRRATEFSARTSSSSFSPPPRTIRIRRMTRGRSPSTTTP
jgi:hypothetical protein